MLSKCAEGHTEAGGKGEPAEGPARSRTLSTRGNSPHGTRETREEPGPDGGPGRSGKAESRTPDAHTSRGSDDCIVPEKRPNKEGEEPTAEDVEGRRSAKGNHSETAAAGTQSPGRASIGLRGVREAARKDKGLRFTALLHHVNVDLLRSSFRSLRRAAAPGVDGMTCKEYEDGLEGRLKDLHERVHTGKYRAQPSRRTYILKADGRQRPLGVAALEDKIVQHAVVKVLNNVYEEDFLGFSYGFRPGKSQHDALDALYVGIVGRKVNWVLDADIRGFFDTISHEWMMKFLEHRIADKRVLRLARKWLRAGVSEDGEWSKTTVGTPQGAVISPLLANIYLHYVLDLWAQRWRKKEAKGDVIIVRYADDFVMGFQHRHEAERFLKELKERVRAFGLALHQEKTRLIEFGRFAAQNRKRRGAEKPDIFDFLGFTHKGGTTKNGRYKVVRETMKKRLRAKLVEVRKTLMVQRHAGIHVLGTWLRSVVIGYMNYHAVPGNLKAINTFRSEVIKMWLAALRRRSQKARLTWAKFRKWVKLWIPSVRLVHPYPTERFYAKHPRQEPYAGNPHVRICAGGAG